MKSGYLNKHRPHAASSLWSNTWESRYFILRGQMLTYYKSERDVHFPPRGEILLTDTYLDVEGLRKRKFWTFKIVDRAGVDLIRLSTEVQAEFNSWLEVLEQAGCTRRHEEDSRAFSPVPSQLSPSNSVLSDSTTADTASSGQKHQGQQKAYNAEGYTSDTSDMGPRQARRRRNRDGPSAADACAPVHTQPRFSLLSSERITFSNQTGLLTLVFIVLAATNFRLVLENMIKYGLRFNPLTFLSAAINPAGNVWLLLCWPALLFFTLSALVIEKAAYWFLVLAIRAQDAEAKREVGKRSRRDRHSGAWAEAFVAVLNLINTSATLLIPCGVIHYTNAEPLPSFVLTTAATVLWLKLVSYAHVQWSIRCSRRRHPHRRCPGESHSGVEPQGIEEDGDVYYPANLTVGNILYFVAAPTLCYQLSYPRSPRVRMRWLLRRILMLFAALSMMLFIIEQYIEPTIDNSLKPLQEMDWLRMVERVLKLSIPTLYFWLAMFYALFDLWLNIVAELTRFGDREFYKEWWNATTLGEYWRLWNMPVHKWMVRHVYFPSLRAGLPKFAAGVVVFFVSAVFHELLVGVPLHMLKGWAFWGIMAQVPLMWVTEILKRRFKNDRVGNVIFWVSFCFLGQPLAEILYFHDWRKSLNGN